MRFSDFFSLGVALFTYAICPTLAQQLPVCAAQCFAAAVGNQTLCTMSDIACICANAPLQGAIQTCVGQSCSVKEVLIAVRTTSTMCGAPVRNKGLVLKWTAGVSGTLALLAIIVRVVVALVGNSFGLDDGFAVLAWLFSMPVTIGQFITPYMGFGQDTWMVDPKNIYKILQLIYASQIGYFLCSGFTKLCFLTFFLRIFPAANTRKTVFVFIGITVAYTMTFDLTLIFACKPISAVWTSWAGEEHIDYCIDQNKFYYCAAAANIALDIAILIIPIPELLKLRLSLKRKLLLLSIFSVGSITIIVSCIRLQSLAQYASSKNPLYDNLNAGVYSVLETNVGVICTCMPSFRRFLATLLPKLFGSTNEGSKHNKIEDGTPKNPISSAKRSNKFKKSTLGGSLFDTQITKTVDTRVESSGSDDEVQLVELQQNGQNIAPSYMSVEGHGSIQHTESRGQEGSFHHGP